MTNRAKMSKKTARERDLGVALGPVNVCFHHVRHAVTVNPTGVRVEESVSAGVSVVRWQPQRLEDVRRGLVHLGRHDFDSHVLRDSEDGVHLLGGELLVGGGGGRGGGDVGG